ncbi:MAG: hydrogenase maturation protease [Armatimonadetes bacterium]|nr:hydrogenase maturation protease [Armatimonadota bacterium]
MNGGGGALVIGVGRPGFGDDALGLTAARALEPRLTGAVRVVADGTGLAALSAVEGEELLVLIDAAESGAGLPAGQWRRLRYPQDAPAFADSHLRTTHTLAVDSALAVAAALGRLPDEVWVYALAGERFAPETSLSAPVSAALCRFVEEIEADVRNWLARRLPIA